MSVTTFMNLELPTVGSNGTLGPTYATMQNTAMSVIDLHDHTSGKGVGIPTAGLNINADLSFGGYAITSIKKLGLSVQAVALTGSNFIQNVNGDFYWMNSSGTSVQITSGGGINLSTLGTIGGDFSSSTATVTYTTATKLFAFSQSSGITADIAAGSYFLYENVASGKYVKLKTPTSLAANYDVTMPAAVPAATKIVTMSSTGALGVAYDLDGSTLEVSSNSIRIKDLGVTGAKLNSNTVDNSTVEINSSQIRVKDSGITTAKIGNASVTRAKLESLGQQVSSSSGAQSNGSTSVLVVPGMSVTITSTGRPIKVYLQSDGTGFPSNIGAQANGSTAQVIADFIIRRDSTDIALHELIQTSSAASASLSTYVPSSSLQHTDVVAAGTYNYKLYSSAGNGSSLAKVNYCMLVAHET